MIKNIVYFYNGRYIFVSESNEIITILKYYIMELYKIESPTTKQIFDAIINLDYVPLEKIQPKAKQIKVLLMNHFCTNEVLITFKNMTNCGGFPVFLSSNSCLHEIAAEEEGFFELTEEEQNHEIELLGSYLQTFDNVFNL